jgi:hypothetical protein
MDIYFWAIAIGLGLPLWWFAFYATKRMRIGKNLEREAQAKRNLERYAMEQAAKAQAEKQVAGEQAEEDQKSVVKGSVKAVVNVETTGKQGQD